MRPIPRTQAGSGHAGARQPSVLLTGLLLGIGITGAIDEAVFHQVLQWHTLYWGTDAHGRVVSDGLFHLVSTGVLVWGALRVWQMPEDWRHSRRQALLAAILMGAGGFNLYDGLVQHLLLHLHLVNEFVCPNPQANNSVATCPADTPFEVAWLVVAAAVLAAGSFWWQARQRRPSASGGGQGRVS
jgi:uncharacterized membrane protein